jgi:hypothetical protein
VDGEGISFWDNEKLLELNVADGYIALQIYQMSLNCLFKMANFKLGIVVHVYNPSYSGGQGGRPAWDTSDTLPQIKLKFNG